MALRDSIINLVLKGKDLISPATDSASEGVGKLQERSDELNAALGKLNLTQRNIKEFKRLGDETERLQSTWKSTESEAQRLRAAFESTERPTRAMAKELDKAEKSADQAKTAWLRNREALDKLSPRLKAAGVNMRDLDKAQDDLEQSSRRLRSDLSGVDTQLKKQKRSATDSGKAMNEAGTAAGGFSSRLKAAAAGLAAFIGAAIGLEKIRQSFVAILQTGDRFEKLDDQLTQIFNSVEKGEEASQWIQDFTANTPLQLEQVSQAFIRLKNFGIDPTNGTLQSLVDQNEAMGGSFQDLEGIINAVGQAWAKQKLQGEEILQLIERGVPVWEMLSEATGKNVTELQAMASAGELGRETISALVQEIGKASSGAAAQSMGRLSGLVSNLKDQWDQFLNLVAESGALDYAKEQLQELLATIQELRKNGTLEKWAKSVSDGIVSVGEALKGSISTVVEYKDELILLGKAFIAVKVVGAIKALGAWTVALRASRAEMMATSAQAAATSRGFASLGKLALGLAKPIPITIALIGLQAATSGLEMLSRSIHNVEDAQRALALQQKEIELQRLREINQIIRQAQALEGYADISVRTGAEIAAMSEDQRQAYAEQLNSAQQYYEYMIEALERQAALGQDVSAELSNMRGELDQVNQTLIRVGEESTRAGEAIRLGISKGALDALVAFSKLKAEGLSTVDALKKTWEGLDLKTPEGISDMSASLVKLVKTAQVSGQNIKDAIGGSLSELTTEGLRQFQRQFIETMDSARRSSEQVAAVMDSALGEAFSRLGADMNKALTGITSVGQAAIDDFGVVIENLNAAGRSSEENAALLQESFSAAIKKVSTEKGLEVLRDKLKDASSTGLDTSEALVQVRDRLREIRAEQQEGGTDISEPLKDGKDAAEGANTEITRLSETLHNNSKEAQDFRRKWEAAWGGAFGKALTDAREKVTSLSKAARNLFEMKIGGNAFVSESESASEALERARKRTDELADARRRLMSNSFASWFADTALAAAEVEEKFWSQAVALENLQKKIEDGNYSLRDLNYLSETAASKFDLLDDQRLDGLQSAIDRTRAKAEQLADSLTDTVESLKQELASLEGDTVQLETLRYQERRLELEERLRDAESQGNKEAVSAAQQALDLQEQAYNLRLKNAKQQAEEDRKRAAQEAAEEERRQQEAEARQREETAADFSREERQAATQSSTRTVILRLETGDGKSREITTDESGVDDLLDLLEESGWRST